MKQPDLKIIDGGDKDPSPLVRIKGTSVWSYVWMFIVSGAIWGVIGYRMWRYFKG